MQQSFDQNSIVRQYTKWDHRMELQDNPGLMISRALQVACTEPRGPVYLQLPREVSLARVNGARFPTMAQLGVARPAAPDPEGIRELAARLVTAENPFVVVARSGRNPATVPALVRLCELMGLPVAQSGIRSYHCFPLNHPLYMSASSLKDTDVVLCLDVDIPWHLDSNPPPDSAWVAITDVEPSKRRIPTMEFTADLRLTTDALLLIEALEAEVRRIITPDDARRFAARAAKCAAASAKRRHDLAEDAKARAGNKPIDSKWLSYNIGKVLDDNCIMFDETIAYNQVHDYLHISRPGSYFHNPASSGGWTPGAAFGAKLAAPDRDIIAVSGDGFYMFGTPIHALWSARHYKAPFMQVVYQNRSYSTGTLRINSVYGKESYTSKGGYDGGYFDPPIDYAKEAEAAGCYGENVTDPAEVEPALRRGLARIRAGQPAVISVWLPRLLQKD
jgi:acetolactate synthase-1/2/3 large subunit